MVKRTQLALNDAADWLGDFHPLAEQLGSASGLLSLGSVTARLRLAPVHNVASLRRFLRAYQTEILLPVELRAVHAAHKHAEHNELRELIALDNELARVATLEDFAAASRRVGQYQLEKLKPLRDQRFVQRYLAAVRAGEAHAWHTLVYGLTLALYSLPLRQGLLGYAHQTLRGFIYAAARPLKLSEHQCRELFEEFCADLHQAVERIVGSVPSGVLL